MENPTRTVETRFRRAHPRFVTIVQADGTTVYGDSVTAFGATSFGATSVPYSSATVPAANSSAARRSMKSARKLPAAWATPGRTGDAYPRLNQLINQALTGLEPKTQVLGAEPIEIEFAEDAPADDLSEALQFAQRAS